MRIRVYEGGSDSWTETNLTPANAPVKTTLLDDITGNFVIGQTFVFDVSGAVTAGQQVTFVVDSDGATSGGDAAFASSENGNSAIRPLLVVELEETSSSVTLWEDASPPDNADGSAVSKTSDPFGTGMGDIGRWITNGQPQYHNINRAGPDLDVSSYNGWDYSFSFDYYVDSSQTLTDDTVYLNAGYGPSNWTTINSGAVLDSWTTVTATGSIDTSSSTTVNPLIIVNHKNTTATTPSFYIDNIRFSVSAPAAGVVATAFPLTIVDAVPSVRSSLAEVDQADSVDFTEAALLLVDRVEAEQRALALDQALVEFLAEYGKIPTHYTHVDESQDALSNSLDDDLLGLLPYG